ncbi:MAG: carboxypeptidase regulatory-like domain-containing protein [Nitrospirota bacterium]|nr:MAG: carboxypeptidase regulatory-like domain-containing protein [Nitrospirota bacterium]
MRYLIYFIAIGLSAGLFHQPVGAAYKEINVVGGGAISGKVTIEGGKPRPMAFNLVTIPDPVFCGTISTGTGWRIVEDFIIGPDKGLKDVVVFLKDAKKGKSFTLPKVRIESKDCDFIPFVNVIKDKDKIEVVNMDPVEHDIQGYETARQRGARVLFNRPLPMNPYHSVAGIFGQDYLPGEPMIEEIHLRKGRNVFVMQCGFHPYMFSWGMVLKNPYYAITKEDGNFEISDVPPGEYILSAWHPGVNKFIEQTVTVKGKGSTKADFVFESPKGRRSVHEIEENPRFGLELLGEGVEIKPTIRLQIP